MHPLSVHYDWPELDQKPKPMNLNQVSRGWQLLPQPPLVCLSRELEQGARARSHAKVYRHGMRMRGLAPYGQACCPPDMLLLRALCR